MGSFNALQTATIRDFSGGLNVITDDLNMDSSYSTIETNVFNNINGTKSIRYGTKLFKSFNKEVKEFTDFTITQSNEYTYKFEQNQDNRIPVGSYVSVYLNTTDANPVLSGIVYLSNEGNIFIRSNTQNVTITTNATVYVDFYKLEVLQQKVPIKFLQKTTTTSYVLNSNEIEELQYISIGDVIEFYTDNTLIATIQLSSFNNNLYYFNIKSGSISDISAINKIKITLNNLTGTRFVGGTYFIDKLILVTNKGEVCTVDGLGNLTVIFNNNIASAINSTQTFGWNDTDSVCFAVFNGILTIWNGVDKPLAVDLLNQSGIYCNYLLDTVTMSNSFVPIAKYAIGFNHYLVAGNVYDEKEGKFITDRLCISSKDSIGTFYSGLSTDADNDAVNIDLGSITSSNSLVIKGLSRYRNQLVVGFDDCTVFGTLGDYIETTEMISGELVTTRTHNPKFDDVIDKHGCICNKTYSGISSSLICLDYSGIPNFSRRNIAASVLPNRISELVAPEIYKNYNNLTEKTIEDRVFAVNNPKENQYLLFIPNNDSYNDTTETICYAYTLRSKNSNINDGAWSKFVGWNFDFGITTALNTVFFGKGLKLYILGSIDNPIYRDYADDPDYPPINDVDISGKEISFVWEFPWTDFGDRAAIKKCKYLALSTTGSAQFNVDMFVDYIYTNKETGLLDPKLSMDFVAGDSYGYGDGKNEEQNLGQQLYGAARRTNTELLFAWATKYKIAKFRLSGSTKFKLNINSLTIYYQRGNIRR